MSVPWHLNGKPYQVQQVALDAAFGHYGYGYFMEMGLGKTAVTINEFIDLVVRGEVSYMTVICPNSLKSTWEDQIKEWMPNPVIHGSWPDKVHSDLPFIQIINIEAIRDRGGNHIEHLLDRDSECLLVVDESIIIKNPQAQQTKRVRQLADKADYVRCLSGAPIVNSALDIWAQIKILGVNFNYGDNISGYNNNLNPFAFKNRYCIMGGFKGKKIVGTQNEEHLRQVVDSVSITLKKKDWTDLPEKLFTERSYQMSPKQKMDYEMMKEEMVIEIEDEVISTQMIITKLMKMQQISSGFVYNDEGKTIRYPENGKFKLLKEVISETPNKLIIFAHYKASIELILEEFPNYAYIRGGMSADEISNQKGRFNNEDDVQTIVCQSTAGKYGHTLLGTTAKPCHTTVFYENDYNLDTRLQAEDRNHRHGQEYPVTYVDFSGTDLDPAIINALRRKQSIADAIIQEIKP